MINHARTLLLNVDGDKVPEVDYPGEEIVPFSYRAFRPSPHIQVVRRILFGSGPDRALLNLRVSEYLRLLHSTELEEYVFFLDSRVTYLPFRYEKLFREFAPSVKVLQAAPPDSSLYIFGTPIARKESEFLLSQWEVEVVDSGLVRMRSEIPWTREIFSPYETSYGLSSQIPIPGTGVSISFHPVPGARWLLRILSRPEETLADVFRMAKARINEEVEHYIFGASPKKPYDTFRNLWLRHSFMPYCFGGLLLATIYRSQEEFEGR